MSEAPAPKRILRARDRARYLEDFQVGDRYEHWPGRTITEADNIQFSLLTMNKHPAHCDGHYAAGTEFGRPLVNSALTLAIVVGMTVEDVSAAAIANLGWEEIRLTAPVFRHSVLLRGSPSASAESLEDMVDIAITECERFFPAFQFVLWGGKSPAEALAASMLDCVGEA